MDRNREKNTVSRKRNSEPPPSRDGLTQLLMAWSNGDAQAFEKLARLVHKELHRLAQYYMSGERPSHTLQASALVNEAYIRLIDWKNVHWRNRAHFYGMAANMMRRILVDYARSSKGPKRSGPYPHVPINEVAVVSKEKGEDLIALDEALNQMAERHPRASRVVELRHFAGLTVDETAFVLKISPETVFRDWRFATTWLKREWTGQNHVTSRNRRRLS